MATHANRSSLQVRRSDVETSSGNFGARRNDWRVGCYDGIAKLKLIDFKGLQIWQILKYRMFYQHFSCLKKSRVFPSNSEMSCTDENRKLTNCWINYPLKTCRIVVPVNTNWAKDETIAKALLSRAACQSRRKNFANGCWNVFMHTPEQKQQQQLFCISNTRANLNSSCWRTYLEREFSSHFIYLVAQSWPLLLRAQSRTQLASINHAKTTILRT